MSNYLALATVTAALREHLTPAVQAAVPGARVTLARPHKAPADNAEEMAIANLYLYQVTPNAALRNIDLPTRSSDGTRQQRPSTGINLHYLMTFYGKQGELEPERMLGNVVKTLHAQPMLSRDFIAQLVADTANYPMLTDSDLHRAIDLVKFSPIPFSLEELSKLWSVFLQTPYTLSTAYVGTAVVIEADSAPASALPVRSRRIFVDTLRPPVIERVLADDDASLPIQAGSRLYVYGSQLKGEVTRLRLGGREFTPAAIRDDLIEADLGVLPAGALRAGAQTLQVVQFRGEPAALRVAAESAAVAVLVHPQITAATVDQVTVRTDGLCDVDLTVHLNPAILADQRVVILLNGIGSVPTSSYSFTLTPPMSDTAQLVTTVTGVATGEYLLRIQVDGALSLLQTDAAGQYSAPRLVVA